MLEAKGFRRIQVTRKILFHCGKSNKKKKLQFKRFKLRHNAQLFSLAETAHIFSADLRRKELIYSARFDGNRKRSEGAKSEAGLPERLRAYA